MKYTDQTTQISSQIFDRFCSSELVNFVGGRLDFDPETESYFKRIIRRWIVDLMEPNEQDDSIRHEHLLGP